MLSHEKKKPVVLQLGKIMFGQQAWDDLRKIADVITLDRSTTREKFISGLKDPNNKLSQVQIIARTFHSVEQTGRFDEEIADAVPSSLIAICHTGAGYDQIDVKYFQKRHIQVSHVPNVVNNVTADTHVFLLLGALRNYSMGYRKLINNEWPVSPSGGGVPLGHDPEGKTVGVLGLGGIGRAVVHRLKPFGFKRFIYHNRHKLPGELENDCEYVSFEELLRQSDVLSINIPLGPSTRHIINDEAFEEMKTGVVIVNTARGAVIDEQALIKALKSGKVRSAGLDVFENEPEVPKELQDMPQVLGLPHMGTHCVETRKNMEDFVSANVESAITSGKVIAIVPEMKNDAWINGCKPLI
ncbi:glyoxylate reductase NDAI_0F04250 [Naumovozyma dairenensis CBS 421]|uniref:Glyoxylate reductase n=1 Tax=Naumovozyma dairenensis (strain ATCC 10597 / BCRC 20456 / CBS 421 / NBRC 0211 / NRRL Y-12639) TaxID=1071378 RepID=G0WD82_NAUDC|nr:hypothetical protein NDAI_0F04250 [Naumovozyma dairenensis CBS 421]CCD25743.1 hypothetical protein NDAI_0F04250 [Naumovozyma dairenensis CBS 421]